MKSKLPEVDGVTIHCAHQKLVPVDKVKQYPRNNKIHTESQLAMLTKAIKVQGFRAPVTVSVQSGYIVRGHARLEAAKRLGLSAVPVDYQNYANEEAERLDRIADNKIAELAEWDMVNIKDELQELDVGDLDMDLSGFAQDAIEQMMTAFHVEEVESPDLKAGDRAPFRQATFRLHDEQWEEVEAALAKAKKDGGGESTVNENSNGNALAWICGRFNRG